MTSRSLLELTLIEVYVPYRQREQKVKLMAGIPPIIGRGNVLGNRGNSSPPPNTITNHPTISDDSIEYFEDNSLRKDNKSMIKELVN